jgi:hypothetical protein
VPPDALGAAVPPLSQDEAQRIIARLTEIIRKRHVILVGGQAVSVWVAQLRDRLEGVSTARVVSRDLDFLGDEEDVRRVAGLLDGRARVARWEDRTPLAGATLFLDSDGHERRIDFLKSVYGMDAEDIRATAIELDLIPGATLQAPLWVMHPERCMESRVHNSALPNKQTDLAWRQLRASILCARAFSELLLDERGDAAVRDVLNLNERLFRFAQSDRSTRVAREQGIEVFDAVLDDERLPERFGTIRLPQMRVQIRSIRERHRSRESGRGHT